MSELLVTVVHDDRDSIKYQIKLLRDGLKHVTPKINFKSCCVWEFTDKVFDENSNVLVILSKQCQSFRRKVLEAFQRYRERCRRVNCRVCVVFEVGEGSSNKRLERSIIERENTAKVRAVKDNENNSESWMHTENAAVVNYKGNGTEETSESVKGKADNINIIRESSYETNLQLATANETTVVIEDFDATSSGHLGSFTDKDDNAVANNEDEMIKNDSGKLAVNDRIVIDETMEECSKDSADSGNHAVIEGGVEMINENLERKFKRLCWQVENDDENINEHSMNNKYSENVIFVKSCDKADQKDPDDETDKAHNKTVREDTQSETDKAHDRMMKMDAEGTTGKNDNTQILDDTESEPHKGNVAMVDSDRNRRSVQEFKFAETKQTTVITSANKDGINEEFKDAIGRENVIVLENLNQSVKWLPKVCSFLFKTSKRSKSLKCVVPNVKGCSVNSDFRIQLLKSLRDLGIEIAEDFERLTPRCCILFEEAGDYDMSPSVKNIKSETMNIQRTGGTIFEYNRSYTDEPVMQPSNEIMYGRESLVLFIIHILYVMEVINVTTMHGQRLWRIKKETLDCDACDSPLEACREIDCDSFKRIVAFLGLSLFNPSLLLLFFTPFPYTLAMYCKKRLRLFCLIWLIICSMAIYGSVSYYLLTLGNTLYFYLFLGIGAHFLCIAGSIQMKLSKFSIAHAKRSFVCNKKASVVMKCFAHLVLSPFNPSLFMFFLTPVPYMVLICCKNRLRRYCLIWLVFCSMAIYGGASYFLWTLGNNLHFYLFLGIGAHSLCLAGSLQMKFSKLILIKNAKYCISKVDCINVFVYGLALLFLSIFNPSLLLFFFTPFPYMWLICCGRIARFDDKFKRNFKLILKTWLVFCTIGIYAGVLTYLIILDNWIPLAFFPGAGLTALIVSAIAQGKLFKL